MREAEIGVLLFTLAPRNVKTFKISACYTVSMEKVVTLSDLQSELMTVLDAVHVTNESYIVERGEEPAVAIIPIALYNRWKAWRTESKQQRLMPVDQLRTQFSQALSDSGYETPEQIEALVHEVKVEMANETFGAE